MTASQNAWTYACLGCIDFINDARTVAYHNWACANGLYECGTRPQHLEDCFCTLDGVPADYTDPITDEVCWYDPLVPESAEFLGILVQKVSGGRDSTFTRAVTPSVNVGSVLQRRRLQGRSFAFEVTLLATSCAGMEYGMEWLRRVTEGATCISDTDCGACAGQALQLRVLCDSDAAEDKGLRTWVSVGAVDGLTMTDIESFSCCCWRKGTFTLHSEEPYSFATDGTPTTLTADITAFDGACNFQLACVNCGSDACVQCRGCGSQLAACELCRQVCGDCDRCGFDPVCDDNNFTVVSPLFLSSDDCFCEPVLKRVQCIAVQNLPGTLDTTFRLELFTGYALGTPFMDRGQRNTRIKIFKNPQQLPIITDDASQALWSGRSPCAQLDVSYIPPDSKLVIDGRTESVTLECKGVCRSFDRVVSSTQGTIFPIAASCHDMMICVEWDETQTQFDATGTNQPATLTVDRFLRYRN